MAGQFRGNGEERLVSKHKRGTISIQLTHGRLEQTRKNPRRVAGGWSSLEGLVGAYPNLPEVEAIRKAAYVRM